MLDKFSVMTDSGKIQTGKFSDALLSEMHLMRINGRLFIYDEEKGIYTDDDVDSIVERKMLDYFPEINQNIRKETLSKMYLKVNAFDGNVKQFSHLIVFKNGVYNINTHQLGPFSSDYVIFNAIPHDYNPNAYSPIIDDMMNKLTDNDAELRALLEEMIGYTMLRENSKAKSFFLWGPKGNNGKSVFQSLLISLLGQKNVSALDLANISKDKFALSQIQGKLANVADDIEDNFIGNNAIFKSLTTGETMVCERKYQNAFEFTPYAKLIFSANNLPRLELDEGVIRRLCLIPFVHDFKKDPDFNPRIKHDLLFGTSVCSADDNFSYLINLALAGLDRIMYDDFTHSKKCDDCLSEYNKECNPIEEFIENWNNNHAEGFHKHVGRTVYEDYTRWSEGSGQKAMSRPKLVKYICTKYNYTFKNVRHSLEGVQGTFVRNI